MPTAATLIILLTRPRPWWGDPRHDALLDLAGVIVALCGQVLRGLVIGLAYIQRGGKNKRIAADRLVTDGIFAHCRHPLCVGNFLILAGLTTFLVHLPSSLSIVAALVAGALLVEASAMHAAGTPEQQCAAEKNKTAGKYADADQAPMDENTPCRRRPTCATRRGDPGLSRSSEMSRNTPGAGSRASGSDGPPPIRRSR